MCVYIIYTYIKLIVRSKFGKEGTLYDGESTTANATTNNNYNNNRTFDAGHAKTKFTSDFSPRIVRKYVYTYVRIIMYK